MSERVIKSADLQNHIDISDRDMEIVKWITDSKIGKTMTEWEIFLKEKGIIFGYLG